MIKRKKIATITSIAVLLVVAFFSGLYLLGISSEPYAFAVEYIDSNDVIIKHLGEIESRRLALFGYSVRYKGPRGHAEYEIKVCGKSKKGKVYLELEKAAGQWRVTRGNLVMETGANVSLANKSDTSIKKFDQFLTFDISRMFWPHLRMLGFFT
jgi:hypothetical protein